MTRILITCIVAYLCLLGSASALCAASSLDPIRRALEVNDPQSALEQLNGLERLETNAEALLLRSSANIMLGELAHAERDLVRAVEVDPALRQGWVNLGAVRLAAERYDEAHLSFVTAERLDPKAADNHLNLGVAELFRGQLETAIRRFGAYVSQEAQSGDAYYTVASNFALAGYAKHAVGALQQAIARDETTRLRARTDGNFEAVGQDRRFLELLATNSFRPADGSYRQRFKLSVAYETKRHQLLGAVIDSLTALGVAYSPQVEVTPDWAVVWSPMRIAIERVDAGSSIVDLSAPRDAFSTAGWEAAVGRLSRQLRFQLTPKVPLPPRGGTGRR